MRKRTHICKHIVAPGSSTLSLTKIDVAEALIKTAVRLFFEDAHPVPVYSLASAAREILTTLGDKTGVETVLHAVAKRQGKTLKEIASSAHEFAKFFKHADRDPTAEITFSETEIDPVLEIACNDFARVTGGMPIETQVDEMWIFCLAYAKVSDTPLKHQRVIRLGIRKFPGVRAADRRTQKRIGLEVLRQAENDPSLKMEIRREVELDNSGNAAKK
jgi:hypothetical protein